MTPAVRLHLRVLPEIQRTWRADQAQARRLHGRGEVVRAVPVVAPGPEALVPVDVAGGESRVVHTGGGVLQEGEDRPPPVRVEMITGAGDTRSISTLVPPIDMNSRGSASVNAQQSITWVPDVLITLMSWPALAAGLRFPRLGLPARRRQHAPPQSLD